MPLSRKINTDYMSDTGQSFLVIDAFEDGKNVREVNQSLALEFEKKMEELGNVDMGMTANKFWDDFVNYQDGTQAETEALRMLDEWLIAQVDKDLKENERVVLWELHTPTGITTHTKKVQTREYTTLPAGSAVVEVSWEKDRF